MDGGTLQASILQFFDYQVIIDNWQLYLSGVFVTLQLTALSLILGFVLAVPMSIMLTSRKPWVWMPVWLYVYCFRGTPLLIQLFLLYYGAGQFAFIREGFLWPFLREAWFCAIIAMGLNTAAYQAEIFRGAIATTPRGEIEAARAFGMSPFRLYSRIILPSSFRRALPAYVNEVIFSLQSTSLASLVTLIDITGAARIVNSRYYTPYEAFLSAAVLYLVITFVIIWLAGGLERRWNVHLARPTS
ncbi:amino acid ABC transporter membrane protein 2, PAAT family [Arboricoccus pini]|uniref:Amino acid ABC transporter membrane protein 2, PAAT family n=1 Tax=Arboricoccus pini TaxID=1963835 RepID=A0A212RWD6_9PROT|nr:ABC transporter permease [Arboricoccus pini]SNB77074.1 amino acid ABC transporter membrane protein 2, PAAT family [Arboricoccus pini]